MTIPYLASPARLFSLEKFIPAAREISSFYGGRPVSGFLVRFFGVFLFFSEFVFLWDLFYIFLVFRQGEKIKLLFGMSDGVRNRWEFKVRGGR